MSETKIKKNYSFIRKDKDFILFHFGFSILCIIVLLLNFIPIGYKLFFLVVIYNIIVPIIGKIRNHIDWIDLWVFLLPLSIFQIFPDWFLSDQLDVLFFPEDGFPKIGSVSGYMAGLWVIPLFIIVYVGLRIKDIRSKSISITTVAVLSLLIFGISEETIWMLPGWQAQNVFMVDHIAVYILIPEIILGLSAFLGYELSRTRSFLFKVMITFLIMLLYTGSASFFYFLIEKILVFS